MTGSWTASTTRGVGGKADDLGTVGLLYFADLLDLFGAHCRISLAFALSCLASIEYIAFQACRSNHGSFMSTLSKSVRLMTKSVIRPILVHLLGVLCDGSYKKISRFDARPTVSDSSAC